MSEGPASERLLLCGLAPARKESIQTHVQSLVDLSRRPALSDSPSAPGTKGRSQRCTRNLLFLGLSWPAVNQAPLVVGGHKKIYSWQRGRGDGAGSLTQQRGAGETETDTEKGGGCACSGSSMDW